MSIRCSSGFPKDVIPVQREPRKLPDGVRCVAAGEKATGPALLELPSDGSTGSAPGSTQQQGCSHFVVQPESPNTSELQVGLPSFVGPVQWSPEP